MNENSNSDGFSWQAMLIVSCLGLIGILILFISGCFNIKNYDELYICFSDYGLVIIFGMFFIGVAIYCWILFFGNVFFKPKKVTLYSIEVEDFVIKFIDKKGKVFLCPNINDSIDVGKYYYTLKAYGSVKKILNESYETFIVPKEKKSYWLNFYSPLGNFENILLLPILYVILLPGLLSVIMSDGFSKIYGIIYSFFPFFLLIYDFIYKIKLNNNDVGYIDDSKFLNFYVMFINIIKIITVVVINIILFYLYTKTFDYTSKLILLPFCLCSLCVFGYVISKIFNNNLMVKFFNKCFYIIFILYFMILFIVMIFFR